MRMTGRAKDKDVEEHENLQSAVVKLHSEFRFKDTRGEPGHTGTHNTLHVTESLTIFGLKEEPFSETNSVRTPVEGTRDCTNPQIFVFVFMKGGSLHSKAPRSRVFSVFVVGSPLELVSGRADCVLLYYAEVSPANILTI
jgi:hypothetical protein